MGYNGFRKRWVRNKERKESRKLGGEDEGENKFVGLGTETDGRTLGE